jgi:glutathione S-transferase
VDEPVLWQLKVSHYNEKARWALDYKGIPHRRCSVDADGSHRRIAKDLTGGSTFPVLELDGEAIGDSTAIVAALEDRQPQPPLYPSDPGDRRRALELEDFFDEELGPYTRLIVVDHMSVDPGAFLSTFTPDIPARRRLVARAMFPALRRRIKSAFGIDERSVENAYAKVRAAGERFQAELQPSGYLVGDEFTVADLTLAALVSPAGFAEEFPYPQPQGDHPSVEPLRQTLAESGLLDWARGIYARHRGTSAEVAAGV